MVHEFLFQRLAFHVAMRRREPAQRSEKYTC